MQDDRRLLTNLEQLLSTRCSDYLTFFSICINLICPFLQVILRNHMQTSQLLFFSKQWNAIMYQNLVIYHHILRTSFIITIGA